jgi:hypothetical protein
VSKELCSVEALRDGFLPVAETLEDIAVDAPNARDNMGLMRKAISLPLLQSEGTSVIRSEIWYEDGSVVLQTQATQFRIHWGVLAQQSSFFRDIQDLPQPSNQPSVDGCPVVELQEDDSADVEYLLKVLYSSSVNILLRSAFEADRGRTQDATYPDGASAPGRPCSYSSGTQVRFLGAVEIGRGASAIREPHNPRGI